MCSSSSRNCSWKVVQGLHHQQVELAGRLVGRRHRGERLASVDEPPELRLGHLLFADQRDNHPGGNEHEDDGTQQQHQQITQPIEREGGSRSSRASPTMKAVIAAARSGAKISLM